MRRWYDPRRSPSIQHFLNGPPGLELPLLGQRPRLELGECRDVWKPRRGLRSQLDAAMMAVANHPLADESIPCFLREGFHDVVKLFNSLLLRRLVGLLPLFLLLPPPVVLISAHTRLARSSRSLIHADGRSLGRRSRHCFSDPGFSAQTGANFPVLHPRLNRRMLQDGDSLVVFRFWLP